MKEGAPLPHVMEIVSFVGERVARGRKREIYALSSSSF